MNIKDIKSEWLVFALIVFAGIFYLSVSLSNPIVFGDENNYAVNGKWIAENLRMPIYHPYFQTKVFHTIFAPKPLFYMFTSFAWLLGGEFVNKLMIPVFSILSAFMLYIFLLRYDKRAAIVSAFALLMLPGFVTYGVLNYVETSLVLFFISASFFAFRAFEEKSRKYAVLAGLFSGFCLLTDTTGLFILPLIFMYFIALSIYSRRVDIKTFGIIFVVALVVLAPWLMRNNALYGSVCYNYLGDCPPKVDIKLESSNALKYPGAVPKVGTGAEVTKIGFINYFNFAFGLSASILLFFGLSSLIYRKSKLKIYVMLWMILFVAVMLQQSFFGGRAEDVPRYTLFGFPAVAIIIGMFASDGYAFLKKYNEKFGKYLGLVFVLFILYFLWIYGSEKLATMNSIKNFSPGFFDACDWIKRNTPKNAYIFTTYAQHAAYHCNRNSTVNLPDQDYIQLTNNDSAYEHLKLHGFDYVFVPRFTISIVPYGESISLKFLNYMETSDKFEKVYDNTNRYGEHGAIIYKVL